MQKDRKSKTCELCIGTLYGVSVTWPTWCACILSAVQTHRLFQKIESLLTADWWCLFAQATAARWCEWCLDFWRGRFVLKLFHPIHPIHKRCYHRLRRAIKITTWGPSISPGHRERKVQATASVLSVDPDLPPFGAGASLGLGRLSDLRCFGSDNFTLL